MNVPEEPTSAISADSTAVNKELQPQPQLQDIQMKGPSQQPQEAGVDLMKEYQGPENLIWFNKMFKVFALEWAKSGYFKEKIMKIFFKSFNKKRSKFVRRIKIKDLIVKIFGLLSINFNRLTLNSLIFVVSVLYLLIVLK